MSGHIGHADGQHYGHDSRHTLRYGCHSQRNGCNKTVDSARAQGTPGKRCAGQHHSLHAADEKDNDADTDDELGQEYGELCHAFLQRSLFFFSKSQSTGNFSHLCVHARGSHNTHSAAVDHGRTAVKHIRAVAQRYRVLSLRAHQDVHQLICRQSFARESCLFRLQAVGFQNAAVRRHGVTGLEADDISDHKIFAFHDNNLAVPHDFGGIRRHLHQRSHRRLRLILLHKAHNRIDDDNRQNDEHIRKGSEGKGPMAFQDRHNNLNQRRAKQHQDHGIHDGIQKLPEGGSLFLLGQKVFSLLLKPYGRLLRGQSLLCGSKLLQYFFFTLKIVFHCFSPFPVLCNSAAHILFSVYIIQLQKKRPLNHLWSGRILIITVLFIKILIALRQPRRSSRPVSWRQMPPSAAVSVSLPGYTSRG